MGDDWAVPGSDKWDQLYASSDEEEPDAPDESTVRGDGPLALEPEPQPQPPAAASQLGPPLDPVAQGRERMHSMLRSSCEWWDRTELSPSAREEWYSVKGQWSKPGADGDCSLDVLGVPMEIRNKQLRQEQERKDASMAIELSNQDAQEEVALMKQMAKDAAFARELGGDDEDAATGTGGTGGTGGGGSGAGAGGDVHDPGLLVRHASGQLPDDPWGAGSSPRPPSLSPSAQQQPPPPQGQQGQMLVVEVSVPPHAQPGSKLQVEIPDGRFVEVALPPGATPGELLRVQVPAAPAPAVGAGGGGGGMLALDEMDEEEMLARALAESMTPTPRGGSGVSPAGSAPPPVAALVPDERLVGELVMMGIEEGAAAAAAVAVRNASVEEAMEYIFSGAGDADADAGAGGPLGSVPSPAAAAAVSTVGADGGQVEIPYATLPLLPTPAASGGAEAGGAAAAVPAVAAAAAGDGSWPGGDGSSSFGGDDLGEWGGIASAPPAVAAAASAASAGGVDGPGSYCPRCEEMESTCGICLAAQQQQQQQQAPTVGDMTAASGISGSGSGGGQEVEGRIAQVCAMGFSREAAENALEVSGQSVEEAIDLLLSQPPPT